MMAQAAGDLGAVVSRPTWLEVMGDRRGDQQVGDGTDGDWHIGRGSAIEASPAKRVSCVPSMFDSLGVQVPCTT